jgi:hypothetical protein
LFNRLPQPAVTAVTNNSATHTTSREPRLLPGPVKCSDINLGTANSLIRARCSSRR